MTIHHLRNATFIIESGNHFILIDPMLSDKGELPPFSVFKHKPQKNPTVPLPKNSESILNKVTHALITHSQTFGIKALQHSDHLDAKGESFLVSNHIPVTTVQKDASYLIKLGLHVKGSLPYWETHSFLGGSITAIPALHGHGWIHKFMANGAGYLLKLPNEPSLYISGDTVLTKDVKRALIQYKPDITIVAAGNASLDVGQSLLMPLDEIVEFVKLSPNRVIANHMEALNHCSVTREMLKERLMRENLLDKVLIPQDGETLYM